MSLRSEGLHNYIDGFADLLVPANVEAFRDRFFAMILKALHPRRVLLFSVDQGELHFVAATSVQQTAVDRVRQAWKTERARLEAGGVYTEGPGKVRHPTPDLVVVPVSGNGPKLVGLLAVELSRAPQAEDLAVLKRLSDVVAITLRAPRNERLLSRSKADDYLRESTEEEILRDKILLELHANERAFFRFLLKRGKMLSDPTANVNLKRREALPRRVLTIVQADRLMAAPHPGSDIGKRDRAILELLYGTGIRGGECARLDLADVDLAGGTLLVRDGKGKKDRVVPLVGRAAAALELYLREVRPERVKDPAERALFLSHERRRLTLNGIEFMVARHARTAGLHPLFPHALRHSCATHLLKGGAHVRHVQELLGHKSLVSTMVYTRVDTHALRQILERAHPRERRRYTSLGEERSS